MPIPVGKIEPGGIYEGANGSWREVVSFEDNHRLTYRVIHPKILGEFKDCSEVYKTKEINTKWFAEWAKLEVA